MHATRRACDTVAWLCVALRVQYRGLSDPANKIKKNGGPIPPLNLVENPDILASLAQADNTRPNLVIGFAAETTG